MFMKKEKDLDSLLNLQSPDINSYIKTNDTINFSKQSSINVCKSKTRLPKKRTLKRYVRSSSRSGINPNRNMNEEALHKRLEANVQDLRRKLVNINESLNTSEMNVRDLKRSN